MDFTRNRKLIFDTVIKYILFMGADSVKDELLKLKTFSLDALSALPLFSQEVKLNLRLLERY